MRTWASWLTPVGAAPGGAAVLVSIAVTPSSPSVNVGATQQMVATGTYSDASEVDLTALATWASASPAKSTVSVGGLVTGVEAGTSVISATLGAVSGNTTATAVYVVPSDGPGPVYVPATAADFTALGLPTPRNIWLCQDAAAGDIVDALGADNLVRQGGGGTFQQAVASWTRKGVGPSGALQYWDAGNLNVATTSFAMLVYMRVDATQTNSRVLFAGSFPYDEIQTTGASRMKYIPTPAHAGTTGSVDPGTAVRPFLFLHDVTNSRAKMVNNLEAFSATYQAIGNGPRRLGDYTAGVNGWVHAVWACCWTGAAAESISTNVQIRTALQALGWTIPW